MRLFFARARRPRTGAAHVAERRMRPRVADRTVRRGNAGHAQASKPVVAEPWTRQRVSIQQTYGVSSRRPALGVAAGGAAALLALALALGAVELPDAAGAISDVSRSLGGWVYLAVPGFAFLETGAFVGLLVPGETAVVVGGVVAERGDATLPTLIILVWFAAVGGDVVSFALGRRLGRPFLDTHGARLRIRPEQVARVDRFFARYGGRAVLVGRFVGVLRALTPFVAGASRLPLRRFLPYSVVGALAWAATFTLVGYAFAGSFETAGETAARIAMAVAVIAALVLIVGVRLRRTRQRPRGHEPPRDERHPDAERRADQPAGDHIERVVHAEVHPREGDRRRQTERPEAELRAEERDDGGAGERSGAVARGERGVPRKRDERSEIGVSLGRSRTIEQLLETFGHERGAEERGRGRGGDDRQPSPAQHVRAEAETDEQRPFDPPGGEHHEHGRQNRVLEERRGLDQSPVEVEWRHRGGAPEGSKRPALTVIVNARASGVENPARTGEELSAVLRELGVSANAAVTSTEPGLWEALRAAAAAGRRVVLVGGDGSLHAAANAPLAALPELAIVPAGRANNIARALRIPTERLPALQVAALAEARPVDALRVRTPERSLYALEAVSAGFQAEARDGYSAGNSADLLQGLRALGGALRRYSPYRVRARVNGAALESDRAAQLFFSNLPYFGFGFEVNPGGDPADGRLETILLEARGRTDLVRLLGSAYRGRHLERPGVVRLAAAEAELTEALPLVADALPLGTTTATVSVEPARLRVASPDPEGAP
jgi:membrane-associated protein